MTSSINICTLNVHINGSTSNPPKLNKKSECILKHDL